MFGNVMPLWTASAAAHYRAIVILVGTSRDSSELRACIGERGVFVGDVRRRAIGWISIGVSGR
jgi:hypothetical protein